MIGRADWRNSASHFLSRLELMPIRSHPRITSESRSLNLLPPRAIHQKYVRQAFSSPWLWLTLKRVAKAGWVFISLRTAFTINAMRYKPIWSARFLFCRTSTIFDMPPLQKGVLLFWRHGITTVLPLVAVLRRRLERRPHT